MAEVWYYVPFLVAQSVVRIAIDQNDGREGARTDAALPQIFINSHLFFTELRNDLKAALVEKIEDSVLKNNLVVFRVNNLHDLLEECAMLLLLVIEVEDGFEEFPCLFHG